MHGKGCDDVVDITNPSIVSGSDVKKRQRNQSEYTARPMPIDFCVAVGRVLPWMTEHRTKHPDISRPLEVVSVGARVRWPDKDMNAVEKERVRILGGAMPIDGGRWAALCRGGRRAGRGIPTLLSP